ncbi:hypothetical protein CIT26_28745 [Mesorhizobium temperatum]|uniref:Uncharacterized protein n=1 Tax=Mesorhizobium temperatum TaxID=241416 RepID=A0A271LDX4_9HYPH|nr:hypothetical protein CIT26_28745 [Mesorhizobium temperatum]
MVDVGSAPHCPAGHFSPYSDGEKDAVIDGFANLQRLRKGAEVAVSSLLPVTKRGEGAGRRMRGGANLR